MRCKLVLLRSRLEPRGCAGDLLQQDVVDESQLLAMQPTVCVESAGFVAAVEASLVLPAPCNSASGSANLPEGLPGTFCVQSAPLVADAGASNALPAPCNSAVGLAKLHHGPPGITSSRSTVVGCKRTRDSFNDPNSMNEDGDEVDSASKPADSDVAHGWTKR